MCVANKNICQQQSIYTHVYLGECIQHPWSQWTRSDHSYGLMVLNGVLTFSSQGCNDVQMSSNAVSFPSRTLCNEKVMVLNNGLSPIPLLPVVNREWNNILWPTILHKKPSRKSRASSRPCNQLCNVSLHGRELEFGYMVSFLKISKAREGEGNSCSQI